MTKLTLVSRRINKLSKLSITFFLVNSFEQDCCPKQDKNSNTFVYDDNYYELNRTLNALLYRCLIVFLVIRAYYLLFKRHDYSCLFHLRINSFFPLFYQYFRNGTLNNLVASIRILPVLVHMLLKLLKYERK